MNPKTKQIEKIAAQGRAMQECNLSGAARLKAGQGACYGLLRKLPAFASPRPVVAGPRSANLMRCRALPKVVAIQPALAGKAINSPSSESRGSPRPGSSEALCSESRTG